MSGIRLPLAHDALRQGWSRRALLDLHTFTLGHGLSVDELSQDAAVIDGRWIAYRDRPLDRLVQLIRLEEPGRTTIWTDGSGTLGDAPAGIGFVVVECDPAGQDREQLEYSENIGNGTNNRAELMAIWRGLQEAPDAWSEITVRSDSEWAIGAASKGWAVKVHPELVRKVRADLALRARLGRPVIFRHVRGHSGVPLNELADRLARKGRLNLQEEP